MANFTYSPPFTGNATPVGLMALIQEFSLRTPLPCVRSQVAAGSRERVVENFVEWHSYPSSFRREDTFGHLAFALRYEPLDLGVYYALFQELPAASLEEWVRTKPTGTFTAACLVSL